MQQICTLSWCLDLTNELQNQILGLVYKRLASLTQIKWIMVDMIFAAYTLTLQNFQTSIFSKKCAIVASRKNSFEWI